MKVDIVDSLTFAIREMGAQRPVVDEKRFLISMLCLRRLCCVVRTHVHRIPSEIWMVLECIQLHWYRLTNSYKNST
jgi:hypothetical protein